jgi:hypothetical protein
MDSARLLAAPTIVSLASPGHSALAFPKLEALDFPPGRMPGDAAFPFIEPHGSGRPARGTACLPRRTTGSKD